MVRILSVAFLIIFSHIALATTSPRLPGTEVQDIIARLSGRAVGKFPCGSGSKSDGIQLKQLSHLPLCIALCHKMPRCCNSGTFCCEDKTGGCMCLDMDHYSCHLTGSIRLSQWTKVCDSKQTTLLQGGVNRYTAGKARHPQVECALFNHEVRY